VLWLNCSLSCLAALNIPEADTTGCSAAAVQRELLGIVTDRPKHPNMAIEATRIGSYTSWPTGKSQTPQQLAKAGFFYAGSTGLDSLCAHPLMLHGEKGGEGEGGGDLS